MVAGVSETDFAAADVPQKFEAGTPPIAEAVGFGVALDWVSKIGWDEIKKRETDLLQRATAELTSIDGLKILGTAEEKVAVISFLLDGVHTADLAAMLDQQGVVLRSGTHCSEPLLKSLGVDGTCRASFGLWNTPADVDKLVAAVKKAEQLLT